MFRAFHVCLKLQKHCKYQHFCDQPAKNAVIYSVFLLGFQKQWYLQCFVHLGSKKYWYLQHFLRFCMAPANDVKTQKCCNLQHFVTSEKRKIVRKMCQNGTFFPIFGTSKTHLQISASFCPPQTPKNVKPHQAKGFSGRVTGRRAPPGS